MNLKNFSQGSFRWLSLSFFIAGLITLTIGLLILTNQGSEQTLTMILIGGMLFLEGLLFGLARERYKSNTKLKVNGNRSIENYFELLAARTHDIVIFLDDKLHICECNSAALRAYGYTKEEFIKLNLSQLKSDKGEPVQDDHESTASTKVPYETIHRRKDGSTFPVRISVKYAWIDDSNYSLYYIHDISDREIAEQKILDEQKFASILIENTTDALIAFGEDRKILLFNRLAREWFGIRGPGLPDTRWLSNVQIYDRSGEKLSVENLPFYKAFTACSLANEQLTIIDANGIKRIVTLNGSPFFGAENNLLGAVVSMHDITENILLNEQVKAGKTCIEFIVNTTPSVIYIAEIHTLALSYLNAASEQLFGYSIPELLSIGDNNFDSFLHPDDRAEYLQNTIQQYKLLPDGDHLQRTFRIKNKAGEWRWVLAKESIYKRDENKVPQQVLGVLTDITQERNNELLSGRLEFLHRQTGRMAKIGGWELDIKSGKAIWTDEIARIHDLEPTEMIDVTFGLSFYHDGNREKIENAINAAITKGTPYDLVLEIVSAKDVRKWVRAVGTPIIEDGEVVKISGIFQDVTEQKKAEESLRTSEQKYFYLYNNMLDGFAYCRMLYNEGHQPDDFIYLAVNDAFEKLTGLKNVTLKKVSEVIPGIRETNPELFGIYSRVAETGSPEKFEIHVGPLDIWLTVSVYSQTKGYFAAIFDNISERKKAEQQLVRLNRELEERVAERTRSLKLSEEKYSNIFRLNPVGIIIKKMESGEILEVNDAYCEITGYSKEDLMRSSTMKLGLVQGQNRSAVMDIVKEYGGLRNFEVEIKTKAGKRAFVTAAMEKIDIQGETCVITIINDITERRQIEDQFRTLSQKYVHATQSAHIGIWEWHFASGELKWDDRLFELYGVTRDNFYPLYNSWAQCLHPEDRDRVISLAEAAARDEAIYDTEFRAVWPDCTIHYIKTHGMVIHDPSGKPLSMLGTGWDVTPEREAHEKVIEMNKYLQQKEVSLVAANRELESFSYSVSHDLRAPLRAIDGFAKILLEEFKDIVNPEARRLLSIIIDNTSNMGILIDNLLSFSRLGRQGLTITTVPMETVVASVVEELLSTYEQDKIKLQIAELPAVPCDATMIRQVWFNLISNAIKFSSVREQQIIEIGCTNNGFEYTFSIRDNGVGFDMRYTEKLFGVFQRLHSSKEFEGTGVGLAIVQRVIQRLNGNIWAESKPDNGAVFYFTLPIRQEQ